jgi:hypothetical protein
MGQKFDSFALRNYRNIKVEETILSVEDRIGGSVWK